jgi:FKBP-type peptidyl-prolyl cis-trans isomerase SlyD
MNEARSGRAMAFREGDVIEFDYELWVEGQDRLYDTTLREAAEKAGSLQEDAFYAPMAYVVGSGRLISGLEKALAAAEVGKTQTVEFDAADAYGARDPKHIETLPIQEFKKNDVTPEVGLPITYRNRRGVVTTVGGGRVRADFNHPLAGKRLKYRFTVRSVAKDDAQKVEGLLRMNLPAPTQWKVEVARQDGLKTATVTVPEDVVTRRDWVVAKLRALMDVRRHTDVEQVRFVESFRLTTEMAGAARPVAEKTA